MQFLDCKRSHITPIIKVADFCNFTCDFCRYPNNPHKSSMPFSTFRTIIEKACEYNFSNNYYELDVVFHGGDYITLNVPPVAFSNVPLQTWSHSVRQS